MVTLNIGSRPDRDYLIHAMERMAKEKPMSAADIDRMLPTSRTCGDCTLCCTTHEIFEMDKPAGLPCPMLKPRADTGKPGCGIYGQHPVSCQGYVCLWKASNDFVPRDWLPKKVGWVLSWDPFVNPHCATVHLDPERPNAWKQAHFVKHFRKLAREYNVLVIVGGGDQAVASFAPNGEGFTKEGNPEYFLGAQVGVPADAMRQDMDGSLMLLPGAGPSLTGEAPE